MSSDDDDEYIPPPEDNQEVEDLKLSVEEEANQAREIQQKKTALKSNAELIWEMMNSPSKRRRQGNVANEKGKEENEKEKEKEGKVSIQTKPIMSGEKEESKKEKEKEKEKKKEKEKAVVGTTITETYDFAGEEIVVTRELTAKESARAKRKANTEVSVSGVRRLVGRGGRKGGRAALLSKLSKKKKMSTIAKSRLDWEALKADSGEEFTHDLHLHSQDGYLEKQAFLHRADVRQFERERDARHKRRKAQHEQGRSL